MLLVFSTFGSEKDAEKAARAFVNGRLAACVSILPVKSVYFWKGKTRSSSETMLMIKCPERKYLRLERALRKMNSYELPEIIAVKVDRGHAKYLGWVERLPRRK